MTATFVDYDNPQVPPELDAMLEYARRTIDENPFIPVTPHFKQLVFLCSMHDEVLFGGAAGGGKSIAVLINALQRVMIPNYHALILRRTFADLSQPDAIMPIADSWLRGTKAHYESKAKTWHFPSGATLTFGYCDNEADKYRYQSTQFQYVAFDELTQFSETQYMYITSRNRRAKETLAIPLTRATSNPGGVGHAWVKARFIDPHVDRNVIFIPSKIDDNPSLEKDEYIKRLNRLDPVTREQLKNGDWNILPSGNMFKREWFRFVDVVPRDYVKAVRFWDLAATPVTASNPDPDYITGVRGVKLRADDQLVNNVCITDVRHFRASPREVEDVVRQTAYIDGKDTLICIETEPGSNGILLVDNFRRHVLGGYSVLGIPSTGNKIFRAQPFSAAVSRGEIQLVRSAWAHAYMDELCVFPTKDFHDDQVDASSGMFQQLIDISSTAITRIRGPNRSF